MGGVVVLGEDRENLCRRVKVEERSLCAGAEWVIESQGLPNLVHELVHALFLGELADDHGFDYGQIPLDLNLPEHRRILWEELACCVLSTCMCAVFEPDPRAFERAWFAEQFEIQGVFHGLEGDLDRFRGYIDAQLSDPERRQELVATVAEGRARVVAALASVSASIPESMTCDPLQMWTRYRREW